MDRPLPYGWISQVDSGSGHTFYVDTKATPPRSIWVHPLDDEQYLREHPEVREKQDHKTPQYSAPPTPPVVAPSPSVGSSCRPGRRICISRGRTKEEDWFPRQAEGESRRALRRNVSRRGAIKAEQKRQMLELRERRHQEMLARQQVRPLYQQQATAAADVSPSNKPNMDRGTVSRSTDMLRQQQSRSGFGGGGMAMPLLGGLAGGLLLGEAMDGFGGDDGGGGDGAV
ncbi:hypothetical protein B0H14DRAFT_2672715, partial [Mycena olivaceomarginata]